MIDFKRLLMAAFIGVLGATIFIGVNFIGDNGDRLVTGELSSKLSPTPLVTAKVTPIPKGGRQVTKGGTILIKVSPRPKVTPRATQPPMPSKIATPTPKPTSTPTPTPTKQPTPTPTPRITPTTTPTPTPTPEITPTPTPTPEITPTPEATPTPETTPTPDSHVVINEIAWMGTGASSNDEWIELYNPGDEDIDLTGWLLVSSDENGPNISLEKIISAGGYFLLERTDDTTVSNIEANIIYTGALSNPPSCEVLGLYNGAGELVDSTGCYDDGWFAGDNGEKTTMERISPYADGLDKNSWKSNNLGRDAQDANGSQINGTPFFENS